MSIYQHLSMFLNCLQFCYQLCLKCYSFAGEKAQALFFRWFGLCGFYEEKETCNSTLCFCCSCYSLFWGVWGCVTVKCCMVISGAAATFVFCWAAQEALVTHTTNCQWQWQCTTKVRLFIHVINTFRSLYVYTCVHVCVPKIACLQEKWYHCDDSDDKKHKKKSTKVCLSLI